ncbi:MAG TPA: class I SAM-dependent methyltransferase, partial [Euryarchaeota archaeon]|nr:class I SAM-dependent methyltransferase [Euryarchaeota archaeon]
CGTGALTLRAAGKGAIVKGIDVNSQMLEIAQTRLDEAGLSQNVRFCEMGVAELGCEQTSCYDVVMSGLCFSELSGDEVTYTLKEIKRILKPGGLLLIADEVTPKSVLKRVFNRLIRCPLAAITYLITQTTTHAVKDLAEKIEEAGFLIGSVRLNWLEDFIELAARNPGDGER